MSKINLSPLQAHIRDLDQGAYLVLASAGSGKTRVLTERIKRLSGRILAITFTNKAATEIKERLGTSDVINKNVFVGTFHSFCQSVLELRFKFLGYGKMPHIFEDDSDRIELIKQAISSVPYFESIYNNLEPKKKNEYTYNALQFISTVKREVLTADERAEYLAEDSDNGEFRYLYETYQDILRSNNAIDFDDIIRLVYELFTNNEAIANLYRKAYSYICIDECQDLNKLQYYLLKSLCGKLIKNVMMVGDPNQSIFGFNGAASSYMKDDFVKDFQAKEIRLEENYRCSKSVIEASNTLMDLKVIPHNYVIKGLFRIYAAKSERDEAEYVVNTIIKLVNLKNHNDIEGEITYDKIAVLGRNKFVFKHVEDIMAVNKIPFYIKSGHVGLKFSSQLMKVFDLYFRVRINPMDKLHQKRLEDFLKVSDINNDTELSKSKVGFASEVKDIVNEITMDNLHLKIDALSSMIKESDMDDDEKKSTLEELDDLNKHLIQYKKSNLNPSLIGFKSAMALGLTNNSNSKEVGVCLSTVHTMKGQESEIVFLIGMDNGTFPDFRSLGKSDELQQERNNAYVAFTRAKRFLFVTYPKMRQMPWGDNKPRVISQFLRSLTSKELAN